MLCLTPHSKCLSPHVAIGNKGSISQAFNAKLLGMQIPKSKRKDSKIIGVIFCTFGICTQKSCLLKVGENVALNLEGYIIL
jgi:hypothetical protein